MPMARAAQGWDDADTIFWGTAAQGPPWLRVLHVRTAVNQALAHQLIQRRDQWRNFCNAEAGRIRKRNDKPCFLALDAQGAAQGTLSVTTPQAPPAEIVNLVVKADPTGVLVLAALTHTALLYLQQRGFGHCVMAVDSSHANFFRQLLGFAPVAAAPGPAPSQQAASQVLLASATGSPAPPHRFFSTEAEHRIMDRLGATLQARAADGKPKRG